MEHYLHGNDGMSDDGMHQGNSFLRRWQILAMVRDAFLLLA